MTNSASEILRIAGIGMELRYAEPAMRGPLPAVTSRFAVSSGPIDIRITVDSMPLPFPEPGRLLFDSGAVWCAFEEKGGVRIDCSSDAMGVIPYKIGLFDREFREGRIFVRAGATTGAIHPLDYPLDEVIVAHLLGRGRGVELHGCGIIDHDGRGHLFVGQSGAGKTTTARVWLAHGDYEIVSDDRVIVRFLDGAWRMFGTPWHGEAELSSPGSAPLAAIHLLDQSMRTEMVALPPAQAAARLFACTFPSFYDSEAVAATIGLLARIIAEVPVRLLRFRPDRSVLDCVQSAA